MPPRHFFTLIALVLLAAALTVALLFTGAGQAPAMLGIAAIVALALRLALWLRQRRDDSLR
ncbi:hypothetical protein [Tropicimonas sediminicola]|uniref:Uncharacterized protein n=1 Tax=Tropicimonas sediminicola TaxID=1031541 RepID=A0A239JYQ2_9RHOB|nr:hypothetical protein [Tropicimonas sediminicola]SNT10951.1 hypothetical protein SAMN05421757_106145 [Tropicimonas sediminicola]